MQLNQEPNFTCGLDAQGRNPKLQKGIHLLFNKILITIAYMY